MLDGQLSELSLTFCFPGAETYSSTETSPFFGSQPECHCGSLAALNTLWSSLEDSSCEDHWDHDGC